MTEDEINAIAKRIYDLKAERVSYRIHDEYGSCLDAADGCPVSLLLRKNGQPAAMLGTILCNASEFTFTKA